MDDRSINREKSSGDPPDVVSAVREVLTRNSVDLEKSPAIVMFSGGGDSTALLLALAQIAPPQSITALHVNYGLRGDQSDADERFCADLCAQLGARFELRRAGRPADGNLQDWAREVRYAAAEELASERGDETVICVAHSADDQAETVLYRLFASPGRRALQGIPERRGRIVRPLIDLRRAGIRAWLESRGQRWREDASNEDPRFARVRARSLLADAEALHPAAVANLLTTARDLREEGAELSAVVEGLAAELTSADGELDLTRLGELPPALGGAVLRSFVEQRRPVPVPKAARVLAEALRLAASGERRELQVEGARLEISRGTARVIDAA